MTRISVEHNYFTDIEEAKSEIRERGLYGGTHEFEAPPSGGTPVHWNDVSQTVYITDGTFRFSDPATGNTHECGRGSKFYIPERTLHVEEEHSGYKGVIGINKPEFPQPFVRAPEELESS